MAPVHRLFTDVHGLGKWKTKTVENNCYTKGDITVDVNIKSNFPFVVDWLIELYYGGEAFTADQPQSFTCPYCGKMGFTETALQEHVASDHSDASIEVVSI